METTQEDKVPDPEVPTLEVIQTENQPQIDSTLPLYLTNVEVPQKITDASFDDLLNYHEKLFAQTAIPDLRQQILIKCLQNSKCIYFRMQETLTPNLLSLWKDLLHQSLKLIYLLQMGNKKIEELEELGRDVYMTDFSQDIWKQNDQYVQERDVYIEKLRTKILPFQMQSLKLISECDKDEYQHVQNMIKAQNFMPANANVRYYIVTMEWFQRWESFAKQIEKAQNPGPINSKTDLTKIMVYRNLIQFGGVIEYFFTDQNLKDGAKEDTHYKVLDEETWKFLHARYQGLCIPRLSIKITIDDKIDHVVEVNFRKFNVVTYPRVKYLKFGQQDPGLAYISRQATVMELHTKLCRKFASESDGKYSAEMFQNFSRLWKFEGDDTFEDAQQLGAANSKDLSKLPLAIQGRILEPNQRIDDLDVADCEIIVMEMTIIIDPDQPNKYFFKPQMEKRQRMYNLKTIPPAYANVPDDQRMKLGLTEFFSGQNQRMGVTGLSNLGNTCFMNSVLQCLANTEPIVKFFLYQVHQSQINDRNTYGTKGRLTLAIADLINDMYLGEKSQVAPWNVKNCVARRAVQFQGFAQHDSQEMLSVILETLHEDCNQISKKPYVEQKDSADRPDEIVAKEFWDGFLQRDKSIFINLFYGQLKSRVQCSVCDNISITFDPFNVLSLPIPSSVKQKPNFITVTYYPLNIIKPLVQFTIDVDLQRERGAYLIELVNEMVKQYVFEEKQLEQSSSKMQVDSEVNDIPREQQAPIRLFIFRSVEKRLTNQILNDTDLSSISSNEDVIAFERHQPSEKDKKYYEIEILFQQPKSSYLILTKQEVISQSRIIRLGAHWNVRKTKKKIFELLRPLIKDPNITQLLQDPKNKKEIQELEFKHFFEDSAQNPIYNLQILNNLKSDPGVFYNSRLKCEFCGLIHAEACDFTFKNENLTIADILQMLQPARSRIVLAVTWKSRDLRVNLNLLEKPKVISRDLRSQKPQFQVSSSQVSLLDCFKNFTQEEQLKGEDKWFCAKCKNHVVATKKMEIYTAPEYLIIHLKRFSHSRGVMGGGRKVGSLISFPVEGMDLSKQILKNSNLNEKTFYDLYAVSNHFGGLDGGHYTAFCKNPVLGKWYDCDDSTVSKMSASDVITKAAYVLFYKRRQ